MKNASHKVAVVIVAAGRGLRAGGEKPKQWQAVAGRRIVDWSVSAFAGHRAGFEIVLVLHPDDMGDAPAGIRTVAGGATRGASVRAGLEALADDPPDLVLIHDAARPGISAQVIDRVLAALEQADGAAPALAVTDALWRADGPAITGAEPREGLYRAQTPQGFHYDAILNAHRGDDGTAADDVAVALAAGLQVVHVAGDEDNLKVTTKQDFARIEKVLRARMTIRIGNGFDVHRFGPGDAVTLCGISIPHDRGLQGHSDADVGMHALTDAIYGALAEGDIGRHFPPSEAKWKGADSRIFLEHAVGLARARGLTLGNADVTLICEHPKIGPHAADMSSKLAEICAVGTDRISVKATTSERLGFTGREEGIAAMATVALVAG